MVGWGYGGKVYACTLEMDADVLALHQTRCACATGLAALAWRLLPAQLPAVAIGSPVVVALCSQAVRDKLQAALQAAADQLDPSGLFLTHLMPGAAAAIACQALEESGGGCGLA